MPARVGKYEIGKTIGVGTFGKVRFARNAETGERVAMKILDKAAIGAQGMKVQVARELEVMKMLSHPNIVGLFEVMSSRKKIFIALELVTGGELYDAIRVAGHLTEDKARNYFLQLVAGVAYCHSAGVSHRDLKPENILLAEDGTLKISDFGLANFTYGSEAEERRSGARVHMLRTTCGTPNYVAPEILTGGVGYDGAMADTWSCGVILYVMLSGKLPFDEPKMSVLFQKIAAAEYAVPASFSVGATHLLAGMLLVVPAERLSLAQIQLHPWCRGSSDGSDAAEAGGATAAAAAASSPAPAPALAAPAPVPALPAVERTLDTITIVESPNLSGADVSPLARDTRQHQPAPPLDLGSSAASAVPSAFASSSRSAGQRVGGEAAASQPAAAIVMSEELAQALRRVSLTPPPGVAPPPGFPNSPSTFTDAAEATTAARRRAQRRNSTGGSVTNVAASLALMHRAVVAKLRGRRHSWTAGAQDVEGGGASPKKGRGMLTPQVGIGQRRPSLATPQEMRERQRRPSRSAPLPPPGT
tara:strand:+ start:161 stop:1753 length:1593 start_codon:yes stop_codon:yes gene_type:complete